MRIVAIVYLMLLSAILFPMFCTHRAEAASELYVDYITIDGHSFIKVEKPGLQALVPVSMDDDIKTQVKAVCKVIKCNNQ